MTRRVEVVRGGAVLLRLRDALAGGPAILPAAPGAEPLDPPAEVEQRVALIVETSGSTGRPKRVALSADALLANAAASTSALGGPGQWVLALPTHYIAGLNVLARSFAAGIDPVAVEGEHFTADGFTAAARRIVQPERLVALVPAQLATLLDDREALNELRRFQAVLVGGQSTPAALADRALDAGVRLVRSYGSSETSGGVVYDGRPVGGTAVRVEDGEVWLGGPSLAEGYLDDPGLTAERFVERDGKRWFRTADGGTWDGDRLTVTGRRDDVLISGGVKVALAAVERVLREQPGLHDAVVVAAPDERWGQVPVAYTVARLDDAGRAAAIAAVGEALGAPARPARLETLDALPALPSGKPDRRALTGLASREP
ncbi:AMP-binding protein [Pseudolysinimonas sp.]|uniref:AMP-binding protein n=1 Tax=Pseudolysinimonas sp. TaxID=2680009 RepID=UPI003F816B68